ncbi:MAG: cupin domain-containing protein [Pseudobdellovibrionaceae bacterium]
MIIFKNISHNLLFDAADNMYPSRMDGVTSEQSFTEVSSSYYGFVYEGEFTLNRDKLPVCGLTNGMYFCVPGPFKLMGQGKLIVIERKGYRGLFSVGGPVESRGRLTYIDQCKASLLISPARLGEPCLNLLTFQSHITQSEHIHPTFRMGLVYSGSGLCLSGSKQLAALKPGHVFYIEEGASHYFQTQDEPMVVIAFHPDSDWGPQDEAHPMLNRTYLK